MDLTEATDEAESDIGDYEEVDNIVDDELDSEDDYDEINDWT